MRSTIIKALVFTLFLAGSVSVCIHNSQAQMATLNYSPLIPIVWSNEEVAVLELPSLKGVWYRGPFEHNGSVATLEDWFDPRRLADDYVPTGFRGAGVKTRAVKGHLFGLALSAEDRRALIAFLKTL